MTIVAFIQIMHTYVKSYPAVRLVGVLLAVASLELGQAAVIYPSYVNVIPCVNTPENCARNYYQIQQTLQSNLIDAYNAAVDSQNSAGSLLTQVTDPVTGLKVVADKLTDLIDPDNTRTYGGEYRNLPTGPTIVGLTPYMYTLAQRMVNTVTSRGNDLRAAAGSLKAGMDSVTKILQDAQTQATQSLQQIAASVPQRINAQSVTLRDYFNQIDQKMSADSTNFDTAQSSAPMATLTAVQSALNLEASDANATISKLQQIQADVTNQPVELSNYIASLLSALQTYMTQQQLAGDSTSVQKSTDFTSQLVQKTTSLSQGLQGILTSDKTSPYYNSSLPAYIALKRKVLDTTMSDSNQTQQSQINTLTSSVQQLSKSVSNAFQPVLADVNSKIAILVGQDQTFQNAANKVMSDASATITKANSSFSTFSKDLTTAWNLTEGVLTGQITNISASLLNTIGSMNQQAGQEVSNLNDIMNSLASASLASDSVRQSILSNSRDQVVTYIGSNEAALNASFSSILTFLNSSSSELALISNVLNTLSGQGQSQLNSTAAAVIDGITNQIALVKNQTSKMMSDLLSSVNTTINSDQASVSLIYNGLSNASQAQLNQTLSLIAAMQADNAAAINSSLNSMANTSALVYSAANLSASLLNQVTLLPTLAQAQQANQTQMTNAIRAQATANLTALQSSIQNKFASIQGRIQNALTSLSSNESSVLQGLSGSLSNSSASFDQLISSIQTQFSSKLTQLQSNVSLANSQVADYTARLSDASAAIDNANRDATNLLASDSSAAAVEAAIRSYTAAAKTAVMNELSLDTSSAQSDVSTRLTALKSAMTGLEAQIQSIADSVKTLRKMPQDLIDRANQLQSQYSVQLGQLRASILTFSSDNDDRASKFSSRANSVFGSGTSSDGKPGLQALLTLAQQAAAAERANAQAAVDTARSQYADIIASGGASLNSKSHGFLATIQQHRAALNSTIADMINSTYTYMNNTYGAFATNMSRLNDSIYSGFTAGELLQNRLSGLASDVDAAASQVNDMTDTQVTADLIARYGSDIQTQISNLLTRSNQSLTSAQQAELNRQLLLSNSALGAAGNLNTVGSSLADAVDAALATVTSVQGQIQANTNAVKQKLRVVAEGSNSTVQLTASDIAAIIQQFSSSASATRDAVNAQLRAAGDASQQIQFAMNLWNSLQAQAQQLSEDELDDLTTTKDEVLSHANANVTRVLTNSKSDADSITTAAQNITRGLVSRHQQDMNSLDKYVSDLDNVASDASAQRANYDSSVSALRGYVSTVMGQLNSRLADITNQGSTFRTAVESAAAQDIASITR